MRRRASPRPAAGRRRVRRSHAQPRLEWPPAPSTASACCARPTRHRSSVAGFPSGGAQRIEFYTGHRICPEGRDCCPSRCMASTAAPVLGLTIAGALQAARRLATPAASALGLLAGSAYGHRRRVGLAQTLALAVDPRRAARGGGLATPAAPALGLLAGSAYGHRRR